MLFLKELQKVFTVFIISLQLVATIVAADSEKWCMVPELVRRSRLAWRNGTKRVTWRTWLGFARSEWRPYTYRETEYYYDHEYQRKCCSGYLLYSGDCEPICSPECPINGFCSEPNICKCNSGYEEIKNLTNSIECSPICGSGCPFYSTCTAPYECTCNKGYKSQKSSACEPICADGCTENSTCTAPDICSCNGGYATKADSTCEPICSSCPSNSWCDSPFHCSCKSGYLMSADQTCQPNCEMGCPPFSSCFAPGHCECEPGHRMNENATLCEPRCDDGCPERSVCLRPKYCQCDEGYRMQIHQMSRPYCEAICEMDCSAYGKCVQPGVCECLPGYEISTESAEKTPLCRPVCTKGCEHGFCFMPEICVCDPGYLMGPNSTCEPTCSLGCVHGKCVEPEICACAEGYRFQEGSVHICEPICEPVCESAECVAPGICICWNRYQPAVNSSTVCVPTCPSECLHGHCSASFECSCDKGYVQHSYLSNECVPRCENCQNGDCFVPDECNCWPGYRFQSGWTEQCVWISDSAEGSKSTSDYEQVDESTGAYTDEDGYYTSESSGIASVDFDFITEEALTTEFDTEATTTYVYTDLAATITTAAMYDTAVPQVDLITELVASSRCEMQCKCWTEIDELGTINTAKCLKICADDYDEPCLKVSQCRCDLHRLQLVCNNTDDSYEELPSELYECHIRVSVTNVTTESAFHLESNQNSKEKQKVGSVLWWIIGGVSCAILALTALAILSWRYIKNNQEEEYDVVYQDGNATVTM